VFVWAAIAKILDFQAFQSLVEAHRLPVPGAIVRAAALALPGIELTLGAVLLAGLWRRRALACSAALLAVFLVVTGQAWIRGLPISCGCFDFGAFGVDDKFSNLVKLFDSVGFAFCRDLVLVGLNVALLLNFGRRAVH
jgi:hypothetical protein